MILSLQRNGRIFLNKQSLKDEELLDIFIKDKKQNIGLCYKFFTKVTGLKFKKGELRTFELKEDNNKD